MRDPAQTFPLAGYGSHAEVVRMPVRNTSTSPRVGHGPCRHPGRSATRMLKHLCPTADRFSHIFILELRSFYSQGILTKEVPLSRLYCFGSFLSSVPLCFFRAIVSRIKVSSISLNQLLLLVFTMHLLVDSVPTIALPVSPPFLLFTCVSTRTPSH